MHFDCPLLTFLELIPRIFFDRHYCRLEPLAHLVQYIYPIVQLESHTTSPLLLDAALLALLYFCFEPFVVFRNEPGVVDKYSVVFDLSDLRVTPFVDCVECVDVLTLVELVVTRLIFHRLSVATSGLVIAFYH